MNNSENLYCRLCATLKPCDKLTDLLTNDEKRREVVEKLYRLNSGNIDLFSDDSLPKTVCFTCIIALDNAFEFVVSVEQAQITLNDLVLVPKIKQEETANDTQSDNEFDNFEYGPSADVNSVVVKQEEKDVKPDLLKIAVQKQKKNRKKIFKDLDTVPLAQLKQTWKEYNWTCSFCETQFSNVEELKSHSMQYHDTCNAFRCADCNVRKLRLDSFLLHAIQHRKYLKLSCYVCMERFTTAYDCKKHKSVHISSDYICPGCNSNFQNSDELNIHTKALYKETRERKIPGIPEIAQLTNQLTNQWTCILCQKSFKNKASLNTHLLTHTERSRDHTCEKCGKCFYSKQNLVGHMILHDNNRPHKCQICKFAFKTSQQLRNHVGVHDGQKPFACDQCGRCFRLQKQLRSHHIIHTDALPYVCSYCKKRFRFKTILNQHIRQHTGVKPYTCQLCQRDFTNWPNYNKHMKRRHCIDTAKKKHTPAGVYPIDPSTGELMVLEDTNDTEKWKREMMAQRKPGRPKLKQDSALKKE